MFSRDGSCYLLFMLTRAILMPSLFQRPFLLYFAWGFVDLTISSWVYWMLGYVATCDHVYVRVRVRACVCACVCVCMVSGPVEEAACQGIC